MGDYDGPANRITVSRDALRADLAEMELRLRGYFDDQLRHKADTSSFLEVAVRFDRLDRGEWSEPHRRALIALVEDNVATRNDRSWSSKERAMAVMSGAVTFSMLILSIVLAANGGRL